MDSPEQQAANKLKEEGNALYKSRQFDAAIAKYDEAIAACPNDLTYYTNKAAVFVELQRYDECEKMLQDCLEKRYDMNRALPGGAAFEKVGKLLNRLAVCYMKQQKHDEAIACYKKSLAEDNNRDTRNKLRDAEAAKEKHEKESYLDPAKAEEHKEKGNALFKEGKYAEAKLEYDEAIKRNPSDHKLLSNRAAAYQKLLAHPDALRDLDEVLKLDPKFVKAYSRKGASHFFMKDYNRALRAYDQGLALDPNNEGCKTGKQQVMMKIQETSMGGGDDAAPDPQQVAEAMKDPEIQQILKDPQINMILQEMQKDPAKANEYLKDPQVANAMNKLMIAGILRVK